MHYSRQVGRAGYFGITGKDVGWSFSVRLYSTEAAKRRQDKQTFDKIWTKKSKTEQDATHGLGSAIVGVLVIDNAAKRRWDALVSGEAG